eukprot:scpid36965/ scgid13391/ 
MYSSSRRSYRNGSYAVSVIHEWQAAIGMDTPHQSRNVSVLTLRCCVSRWTLVHEIGVQAKQGARPNDLRSLLRTEEEARIIEPALSQHTGLTAELVNQSDSVVQLVILQALFS